MNGYEIIDILKIEEHITFIRINPNDIKVTLKDVFKSLSDKSWLSQFDDQYTIKELSIKYNLSGTTIKYHKRKVKL